VGRSTLPRPLLEIKVGLQFLVVCCCDSVGVKKKLGRVGKDRPTGISLRRSLGFSDRENPRTLAPP
jgi:hypothetical protein